MGQFHSVYMTKPPEFRVIITGLDASGKSTLLYRYRDLKQKSARAEVYSAFYPIESLTVNEFEFHVYDIEYDGERNLHLKRHYHEGAMAVVFVIDASDTEKIQTARQELENLLQCEMLNDAVLLVFANKHDLPNVMSCSELVEKLGLYNLGERNWNIQSCSAITGEGLDKGFEWIRKQILLKTEIK